MSTIVTDTLQGKTSATSITLPTTTNIGSTPLVSTSANSMTIRGEGSATTNIQQGLAKMWCHYNSADQIQDSFNVTSLTDNATGKTTVTIANDMANDNYSATVSGTDGDSDTTLHSLVASVYATGSVKCNAFRQTNGANDAPALNDFNFCNVCILGDLA